MQRSYFYMTAKDQRELSQALDESGAKLSAFVRDAVREKLDREQVLAQVAQTKTELAQLVQELREEVGRTRRDLMDDSQRSQALMREDLGKSIKKNEELVKTFVLLLGGQQPSKPTKPRPGEDGLPRPVPG